VLVRSGSVWAATFHPELEGDGRVVTHWLDGWAVGADAAAS
jgi:glutamine amidotransferase PdxT